MCSKELQNRLCMRENWGRAGPELQVLVAYLKLSSLNCTKQKKQKITGP